MRSWGQLSCQLCFEEDGAWSPFVAETEKQWAQYLLQYNMVAATPKRSSASPFGARLSPAAASSRQRHQDRKHPKVVVVHTPKRKAETPDAGVSADAAATPRPVTSIPRTARENGGRWLLKRATSEGKSPVSPVNCVSTLARVSRAPRGPPVPSVPTTPQPFHFQPAPARGYHQAQIQKMLQEENERVEAQQARTQPVVSRPQPDAPAASALKHQAPKKAGYFSVLMRR